jgi:hypothetical protein
MRQNTREGHKTEDNRQKIIKIRRRRIFRMPKMSPLNGGVFNPRTKTSGDIFVHNHFVVLI